MDRIIQRLKNMDENEQVIDQESLGVLSATIEKLRLTILFEYESAGIPPMAEQHFLIALAHLETAGRTMKLASYTYMKGE